MAKQKGLTAAGKTENPALAQAMAELRRSNAAGTHADRRTRRTRTRATARSAAMRDQW